MKILGIDPALLKTGYGLIQDDNNQILLIEAGLISTESKQLISKRLAKVYEEVCSLIDKFKPKVMALEKLYVHYRHPTTAYLLGQVKGILTLLCAQKKIELYEYNPTSIKKAIVGRGQASKYQVQRIVAELLHLKKLPKYPDITDALAVAIAHSYISKVKEKFPFLKR
ncbi:MAG: crossover junction endodeoxyribonuclease RuvC [Candidatus Omnitrophica bacterium]|nr:crossover junction endodeoxyribonuclease RuvC [Candidatus Omnitrophota bacterium]MCM8800355.1 crossover junction endodeoxyribonuclease RuvC [Candidatus Omnitrophota bacterium]